MPSLYNNFNKSSILKTVFSGKQYIIMCQKLWETPSEDKLRFHKQDGTLNVHCLAYFHHT